MPKPSLAIAAIAAGLFLGAAAAASAGEARLIDAASGRPVAGGTLVVGGRIVQPDAAGEFRIAETRGKVFARAPGYRAATVDLAELARSDGALALQPFTPKALYLTAYGIGAGATRETALALIRAEALNALVIDLKGDRGLVPYPSAAAAGIPGARVVTTVPDLAGLVRMLHDKGIYAIARIVVFKDDPLAAARPELAVRQPNGAPYHDRDGIAWTDPFQPPVLRYNVALAVEAARAGFDEIQFDTLRFADSPQRLLYAARATPRDRLAAITRFLAEARAALLPYNVYLAANLAGTTCWDIDDGGVGERLEEVAQYVDYLSPMLYAASFQFGIPGYPDAAGHAYEVSLRSLETARLRLAGSPKRFRPWVQPTRDYGLDRRAFAAPEVAAQIKAATDFGADGWMLWNPPNPYGLAETSPRNETDGDRSGTVLASLSCP